jgi:death-on-curing protein
MNPRFLTIEIVLAFHQEQLGLFGGSPGLRDMGLLESALAQPLASFGGQYLHEDLHAMAAAYLFHIVQNHPFVDGNKRTGYICALAFLELNGIATPFVEELYDITMAVAEGKLGKTELTTKLKALFPGG